MSDDPRKIDKHVEKFCKQMLNDPESMVGLRKILGFDHSCMADTPEKIQYLVGRRDAYRLIMQQVVLYDQNKALELNEKNLTKDADNPFAGIETVFGDTPSILNLLEPINYGD